MTFLKINNLSVNYEMRRETVYAAKEVNINVEKGTNISEKKVIHHSPENKKSFPSLINVPKEGVVGGTPTPRKLSVDSAIIASASPMVPITRTGLIIFGKICLNIISIFETPIIVEAET